MKIYLRIFSHLFFLVCFVRSQKNFCLDPGYTPENGYRKPNVDPSRRYFEDARITYKCNNSYVLDSDNSMQTCTSVDGVFTWIPATFPSCRKKMGPMFCLRPPNIENGVVLCCADIQNGDECCSSGGKVQFECEFGFKLDSVMPEMICSDGTWKWSNGDNMTQDYYPICVPIESTTTSMTRMNGLHLSGQMVDTVIGVSVGIFSLLIFVIVLAFCKPKFKDIKRRWRDMREDELGLVINGQRVILPSYEQATSHQEQLWCDSFNRVGSVQPPLNSFALTQQQDTLSTGEYLTRMPESNFSEEVLVEPIVYNIASASTSTNLAESQPSNELSTFGELTFLPSTQTIAENQTILLENFQNQDGELSTQPSGKIP